MKQLFNRVVFSLAVAACVASATPASAETVVGVVNVQKIMRDSKAAQSVRTQLQTKQKAFQSDLDAKEKALLAEDQALAKEQATAKDKAAFEKKVKDFRTKAASAQRDVQTKKAQLDKAFAGALEEIQNSVIAIVKTVAAEKKMNVVVSSSQVLYADTALDMTAQVLQQLDAKLPSVSVKF
jgi:outer membrane protein